MTHVRPLNAADETVWRELWAGYLTFYKSRVSRQVTATTFARLIDPEHTTQQAFIAERDGQVIGFTHYLFHAHNWKLEQVCYLQDLFVASEARGTGAGRALIEAVYAAADAAGAPSVYWMTQVTNTTARKLYDRVGTNIQFIKYQR